MQSKLKGVKNNRTRGVAIPARLEILIAAATSEHSTSEQGSQWRRNRGVGGWGGGGGLEPHPKFFKEGLNPPKNPSDVILIT